jgi:hypothetical protein
MEKSDLPQTRGCINNGDALTAVTVPTIYEISLISGRQSFVFLDSYNTANSGRE